MEVLVVDDGSSDRTVSIAEACGVEVVRQQLNEGPAAARNAGARRASGGILIFVDADVVLAPDALRRIVDGFTRDPGLQAVFGSYDAEPSAGSLISDYRNLLHHFTHQTGRAEATTFWSGCGAVRTGAFLSVQGFDERPDLNYIEDVDLGQRLVRAGFRIRLDKGLLATHRKRWTLVGMVRTDVLHRARPWFRLILGGRGLTSDLNLRWSQRVAVPLTVVGAGLLAASPLLGGSAALLGALALAAALGLSGPFFSFLARARGALFAAACMPLHLIHHLSSAAGALLAVWQSFGTERLPLSVRTSNQATP